MNIEQLYKEAYVSKEAGAWDDFINFIRRLLDLPYKNSAGDTAAAFTVGGLGAGAAGFGGYQAYKHLFRDPTNEWNAKLKDLETTYNNKAIQEGIARTGRKKYRLTAQEISNRNQMLQDQRNKMQAAYNKSLSGKIMNSNTGKWIKNLSKGGKWGALVGGAALAGTVGGYTYDALFNRH